MTKKYLQVFLKINKFIYYLLFYLIIILLMNKQLQKIYEQLRPFYQLIFIFDLQPYSTNDLNSLVLRLQGQLQLDEREKLIHERLILKSKDNVEKRIKEKKSKASQSSVIKSQNKKQVKKQMKVESKSSLVYNQKKEEKEESCYIEESCIIDFPIEKDSYESVRTIEGQIYDGKLMVRLPTNTKSIQKQIYYELCPQLTQSSLNKQTYKQFSQIQNPSKLILSIYGKHVEFKPSNSQNNTLGLNYLRSNNILIKSNFRTENSAFSMIFTQ